MLHQAGCVTIFAGLALASRWAIDAHVAPVVVRTSVRFLLSGMLYTSLAGLVVWTVPRIVGFDREDLLMIVRRARQLVTG
jgi:hypothetical protein